MPTRRQLIQQALLLPLVMGPQGAARPSPFEIICEPDCLSQESGRGFSGVPLSARRLVVVCGAGTRAMARAPELLSRAIRGDWIIWESSPQFPAQEIFGIQLGKPFNAGLYIHYCWPCREMTRSFLQPIPIFCADSEVIARHADTPVAMKRRYGLGGVVFLGSMLGPNLHAGEPEAHRIASSLWQILG